MTQLLSFNRTCTDSHKTMQDHIGVIENRLNRAAHCLKKMQSAKRQITLIETAIDDVQMAIQIENNKSRHAVEMCAGKRG